MAGSPFTHSYTYSLSLLSAYDYCVLLAVPEPNSLSNSVCLMNPVNACSSPNSSTGNVDAVVSERLSSLHCVTLRYVTLHTITQL